MVYGQQCILYSGSVGSQIGRHKQQRPLEGFAEDHMGSKRFKGIGFHCTSLNVDIQDNPRSNRQNIPDIFFDEI